MGEDGSGPSDGSRLPPGKTCADGNELDVCTRWRSRILLVGEMRIVLADGDGEVIGFFCVPCVLWRDCEAVDHGIEGAGFPADDDILDMAKLDLLVGQIVENGRLEEDGGTMQKVKIDLVTLCSAYS